MSPYPSKTKRSASRLACALSRDSAIGRGDRFRRRWSALSYSPTIAPIGVRASPESLVEVCRWTSASSKLDCLPAVAHAGSARRAAMDLAEAWLVERGGRDGVILTTDADSQVAPNWIAENLAAFEAGAEAVLGRIDLDEEGANLPEALHRRGALEDTYERLLTELSWLLDPRDHDPWPHHATISGASLGVTRTAYCRVGRLPRVPLGEDKALIALLSRHDARIRHCPTAHVITSGRTEGARLAASRRPLRSEAGSRTLSVTTPWSPFALRLRAPLGEDVCDDCRAQDAWLWIKIGWPNLGSPPKKSATSSKSPRSARHGTPSRIEARCSLGDC